MRTVGIKWLQNNRYLYVYENRYRDIVIIVGGEEIRFRERFTSPPPARLISMNRRRKLRTNIAPYEVEVAKLKILREDYENIRLNYRVRCAKNTISNKLLVEKIVKTRFEIQIVK